MVKRQTNAKPNPKIDHYLRCVFKPFESMGKGGLRPDSASNKIILRDIIQAYDVVSTSGFGIKISPMYPYCVSWWVGSAATNSLVINSIPVPPAYATIPCGYTVPAGKADADFSGVGGLPVMSDYEKARIQTIGWRLIYTGKPIDAQGYILADSSAFQVDVYDRQVPSTATYYGFVAGAVVNYPATTSCAYANVETTLPHSGTNYVPTPPTQTSCLFRPEEGAHGVLKRSAYSPNHTFKPVWNGGVAVMDHRNGDPNTTNCWISSSRSGSFAGNTIIDDDFDSTLIHISAAGNFRLEVITCLEAVVLQSSNLEPLAKASPPLEQQTLEQESKIMAEIAPAVPTSRPVVSDNKMVHTPSVTEQINALADMALSRKTGKPVTTKNPVIINPKQVKIKPK